MKKPLIWLLGDSLIDYGNWQQLLKNWNTCISGQPGERAGELLERLPSHSSGHPPVAITIMSGTNDLLLYNDISFTKTIEKIITTLKTDHPSAKLLLTSLLPFNIPGTRNAVSLVNDEFKNISRRNNCIYVDLFHPFDLSNTDPFNPDGVHLNEHGYQIWAELLIASLQVS